MSNGCEFGIYLQFRVIQYRDDILLSFRERRCLEHGCCCPCCVAICKAYGESTEQVYGKHDGVVSLATSRGDIGWDGGEILEHPSAWQRALETYRLSKNG